MKNGVLLLTVVFLGSFAGVNGANKGTKKFGPAGASHINPAFLTGIRPSSTTPIVAPSTQPQSISQATAALGLDTKSNDVIPSHIWENLADFESQLNTEKLSSFSPEKKQELATAIHNQKNLVLLEYVLTQAGMNYEELVEEVLANKMDALDRILLNLTFSEYQSLIKLYGRSSADSAKLNEIIAQIQATKPELNLVVLEYLLTKFGGNQSVKSIDDLVSNNLVVKKNRLNSALEETKTGNFR